MRDSGKGERHGDAEGTEAGSEGEEGKSRKAGRHAGTAGRAVRSPAAPAGGISGPSAVTAADTPTGRRVFMDEAIMGPDTLDEPLLN